MQVRVGMQRQISNPATDEIRGLKGKKMINDTKKYFVYILQSTVTKKYYAGQTYSVEKRLQEHNEGLSNSTKFGKPWELVWTMEVNTRKEAMQVERKIKSRGIKRFLEDEKNKHFGM
jgi:putative endonuclease